jgi:hypothetical protein
VRRLIEREIDGRYPLSFPGLLADLRTARARCAIGEEAHKAERLMAEVLAHIDEHPQAWRESGRAEFAEAVSTIGRRVAWSSRRLLVLEYGRPGLFWWHPGSPTPRDLAALSLLCGHWPGVRVGEVTAEDVLQAEAKALNEAAHAKNDRGKRVTLTHPDWLKIRPKRPPPKRRR